MPPKGRPPVPTEVRNAQGGTSKQGAVSHRPAKKPVVLGQRIAATNRPEPPAGLPPKGKEMWNDIVEKLIDYNAATVLDVPLLTLMCQSWGLAQAAWDMMIANEAHYDTGSTGQLRESPLMNTYNVQSAKYLRYAEQFGLSTLARTRLAMLDVTTRSIESDLNTRLGRNPRRTNREIAVVERETES